MPIRYRSDAEVTWYLWNRSVHNSQQDTYINSIISWNSGEAFGQFLQLLCWPSIIGHTLCILLWWNLCSYKAIMAPELIDLMINLIILISTTLQWRRTRAMASEIRDTSAICSTAYSGWHQRKHKRSVITITFWVQRWPVVFPHKRSLERVSVS